MFQKKAFWERSTPWLTIDSEDIQEIVERQGCLVAAEYLEALFLHAELPPAVLAFRRFRRTMQARRADT
jgi:hypothetical protein